MKSVWQKTGKAALVSAGAALIAVLLAVLPLSGVQAAPQTEWSKTRVSPNPTPTIESNINDNFFLPGAEYGWAVGSPHFTGAALNHCWYTPDGGDTWTAQTIGDWTTIPVLMLVEMEGVYFRNANLGWTCGQMGIISRCSDGAAGTWTVTRLPNSSEVLQDVFATSDTDVWAVGVTVKGAEYAPLVVRSTDGGLTWSYVDLAGISFVDSSNGWAVGPAGMIIHTGDGGTTWGLQASGTAQDLNAVFATSATEAWAAGVGGTILHTTDAGTTWSSDYGANAVFTLDDTHTWVGGQLGLIMFYDGTGWTLQDSGVDADITGIHFATAGYGWACGDGSTTLFTTDGGGTWSAGPVPGAPGDFNDIAVYDDTGGSGNYLVWVCGQGGAFYKTTDAGAGGAPAAWSTAGVTPPPAQDLRGIDASSATAVVLVGASGTAAHTADGGDTWTSSATTGTTNFTDVTYGRDADCWIATAEDGGLWLTRDATNGLWAPMTVNDVCNAGEAGTEHYAGNAGTLLKRVGSTWTVQDSGTAYDINAIAYGGTTHDQLWAAGAGDTVLYSDTAGATWQAIPTGLGGTVWNDISVVDAGGNEFLVTVVGDGGVIYYTTMANPPVSAVTWDASWVPIGSPDLNSVTFFDEKAGWAVGESGTVWQTLDGADHWNAVTFNDCCSVGENDTYLVGSGGTIVHWDGVTDTPTLEYNTTAWTSANLNAVHMTGAGHGYAVGDDGTVILCDAGWQTPVVVGTAVHPDLKGLDLIDIDNGYAVGSDWDTSEGYYVQLDDGTWGDAIRVDDGGAVHPQLAAVSLDSETAGYAVGESGYYVELSGGVWQAPAQVGGANPDLNGVQVNGADVYAVGAGGYYATYVSSSWTLAQVGGDNPDLYDLWLDGQASPGGYAVGGPAETGYTVQITAGAFGAPAGLGTRGLRGVSLYDGTHGFACGAGRTLASLNMSGAGWNVDAQIDYSAGDFHDIRIAETTMRGWSVGAAGMAYEFYGGLLFERESNTTSDIHAVTVPTADRAYAACAGGNVLTCATGTWSEETLAGSNDFLAADSMSNTYATIAGSSESVFHTDDGDDWTRLSGAAAGTDDLLSVGFADADNGWFAGQAGMLYRFDGGRVYQLTSGTTEDLTGVSASADTNAFAVGASRTVLLTAGSDDWNTASSLGDVSDAIAGMTFPGAQNGWFAGDNGLIVRYDNGTFLQQASGTAQHLNAVSLAFDTDHYAGAAVGAGGTIRYTADSGATWSAASGDLPSTVDLNGIEVVSATKAILCGDYDSDDAGTVRVSSDAGGTWTAPATPPPMPSSHQDLLAVSFGDSTNDDAWVVGTGGDIYTTADLGDTWTAQASGVATNLGSVCAYYDTGSSNYTVFASGETRTVLGSVNGGADWTVQSGIEGDTVLYAASAVDADNVYVVGANVTAGGIIASTDDAGVTFATEVNGTVPPLNGVCACDASAIWAVGDGLSPGPGTVLFNNGGGWAAQDSNTTSYLLDVACDFDGAAYRGVLVGANGTVARSVNAGAGDGNWTAPTTNINHNDVTACTYEYSAGLLDDARMVCLNGTILSSTDGGDTIAYQMGPSNQLNGVNFADDTEGWACGTMGTIIHTGDGGSTWTAQESGTLVTLNGIYALDATHVIAVGDGGMVFWGDGTSWAPVDPGTTSDLYGIFATDLTHLWVVGGGGAIRFYDGADWHDQDTGTAQLNAVTAVDDTHVWAVGDAGTVLFWDGSSWEEQESGTTGDLQSVSAPDGTHAWACGLSATMIRTTDGGENWSTLDPQTNADLYGVRMIDDQNGWAVGANEAGLEEAEVVLTNDGGNNWTPGVSNTGIARRLYDVCAANNAGTSNWDFYAAGDWGLIQKISNTYAIPTITPPLDPVVGTVVPATQVTITGTNFGPDQATVDGHVIFNGGAEGTVGPGDWSDTEIVVTVPSGAFGWEEDVRVKTDGGTSNGAPFTVTPSIASATSPVTGGNPVTIDGEGFGEDPGAGHRADADHNITIGGTLIPDASVTSWTNTEIILTLPDNINPGSVGVVVTAENAANVSGSFDITVTPHVSSLTPNSVRPGDEVVVSGTNFGADPGEGNRHSYSNNLMMNTATGAQIVDEPSAWSPTSITFTVPYEFGVFQPRTGNVQVTASSEVSDTAALTVLPRLDALSSDSGKVGDEIAITGACLGDAQGTGVVTFNGTEAASYTSWHDNQVVAAVPDASLPLDVVRLTIGADQSNTLAFSLTPDLESMSRDKGRAGDTLQLTGSGFGTPQGVSDVFVGGVLWDTVTAWSRDSITLSVPNNGRSGDLVVTTPGGSTPAGTAFTVLPKITSLNPDSGVPGRTVVSINGYAFGDAQGTSKVTFNGKDAGKATFWTSTQVRAVVPVGASAGNVVVTTPDGASNGVAFSVGPYINSIVPDQSPPGGEVIIKGENFKATQGNGRVLFNGVDAGRAVSWSDREIEVKVPDRATTGDVIVVTSDGASNRFPFTVGLSSVFYFAEGTTRANFEEWICLMNPNDEKANIQVLYMLGDGTVKNFEAAIPRTSRMTLYAADVVGLEKDVSAKVTSDIPIVAERPMYFNYGGVWNGGHDVIGAIAPAQDWYFAEGTTRDGFEEWICLQNPGDEAANVEITYMLSGGKTSVQELEVPATSRKTVSVKGFLGPNVDCSARVHSDRGIIAERPIYFMYKPGVCNWTGGHDVMGANAPSDEWYFAEGTTRAGFDEWLCLQNPGTQQATVTVAYMLETGETRNQVVAVEPQSRRTLDVVEFLGRGRDVSMHVTSSLPIVAERPMYFDYVGLTGGSNVIGATCSARNWYFAEGATQNGFQEWLSIQNPGNQTATVTITYMLGTGQNVEEVVTVKPHARATVDVNAKVGWGRDVSAKVTSLERVIVERPMYFNNHGWTGGHDVVGFHY